jgi:hypothetical protein
MVKRAGAVATGHAGGATVGGADCAKAAGWIARMIPNAKIHLERILMEPFPILDDFRTRFHRRVLRTALFFLARFGLEMETTGTYVPTKI